MTHLYRSSCYLLYHLRNNDNSSGTHTINDNRILKIIRFVEKPTEQNFISTINSGLTGNVFSNFLINSLQIHSTGFISIVGILRSLLTPKCERRWNENW